MTVTRGPGVRIETARLVLRLKEPRDAPLLKAAIDMSLPELRQWMPWAMEEPSELDVIEQRIARFRDEFHAGVDFTFGIFDPAELEILGGCGLHPGIGDDALELGYWIRSDVVGRGYATEAAAALTTAALRDVGVARVQIRCDPANVASAAIPRKLGYRHIETLIANACTPDGAPRDTLIWEMVRPAETSVDG